MRQETTQPPRTLGPTLHFTQISAHICNSLISILNSPLDISPNASSGSTSGFTGHMTMARPWITSWGLTWSNNTASLELPNIRARTQRSGLPMSNSGNLRRSQGFWWENLPEMIRLYHQFYRGNQSLKKKITRKKQGLTINSWFRFRLPFKIQ